MDSQSGRGLMPVFNQQRQDESNYLNMWQGWSGEKSVWPTGTYGNDSSIMESLRMTWMWSPLRCCFLYVEKVWCTEIWLRSPRWACLTSRSIPRPNLAHGPGATKFMAICCSSDRKLIQWQRAVIKENRWKILLGCRNWQENEWLIIFTMDQ